MAKVICALHMFNIGRCCGGQRVTVEWKKFHAVHGGHAGPSYCLN